MTIYRLNKQKMSARDFSVSPPPAKRFRRLISVAAADIQAKDPDDISVYSDDDDDGDGGDDGGGDDISVYSLNDEEEQEEQELFLHQEQCLDWMEARKARGGLIYLDPGMGKTRIALEWICRGRAAVAPGRKTMVVIVVPNSLLIQWVQVCHKNRLEVLTKPTVQQLRMRQRAQRREENQQHVLVLTTYSSLQSFYLRAVKNGGNDNHEWQTMCRYFEEAAFIFDECHIFRNKNSKLFLALLQMTTNSPHAKWCFSGTPVVNWPKKDLSSLTTILGMAPPILKCMSHPLSEFAFHRGKHLLSLPPCTEEMVECDFNDAERHHYDTYRLTTTDSTLTKIRTLRYMCSNVVAKFDKVLQIMQQLDQDKMLVFSESVKCLENLQAYLSVGAGAGADAHFVSMYHGKMTPAERNASLVDFETNAHKKVLLMSMRCGSVGLNITGASKVVILEPHYAPAIERQAADRVHRPGQTKPVHVFKLCMVGSVESWVQGIQKCKSSAFKAVKNPKLVSDKKVQKEAVARKQLFSQFVEKAIDKAAASDNDDNDDDDDVILVPAPAPAAAADATFIVPDGEGEEQYDDGQDEEDDDEDDEDDDEETTTDDETFYL
jgi:SNF2 family DNA or RNA helicase